MSDCIYQTYLQTPLGGMSIVASQAGIRSVNFFHGKVPIGNSEQNSHLKVTRSWLESYFASHQDVVKLIPIDFVGTEFEKKVWAALLEVPMGKLSTYEEIAQSIGCRGGFRAVGSAIGKNPISIIVPCHRVIGKNKTLTGYAGGLIRKQWLLRHEGFSVLEDKGNLAMRKVFMCS